MSDRSRVQSPPTSTSETSFVLTLWLNALVGTAILVWLAWGPLLVTSSEEALKRAQEHTTDVFSYAEIASAQEEAVGRRGEWKVRRNENYDSWFEGDRGGFLWIVTYRLPQANSDSDFEFELRVKNLTGEVSGGG